MKRVVVWGLVVVATGLVLLWALLGIWDGRGQHTSAPAADRVAGVAGDNARPGAAMPDRPRPRLPVPGTANEPRPDSGAIERGYREYVRDDGTVVRDHRANARPPDLRAPIPAPQTAGQVKPDVILAVRKAMRPIVRKCTEGVAADSFAAEPLLQSQIVISIADGNLAVDEAFVHTRNVAESEAQALRDCVKQQVEAVAVAVAGHRDVAQYTLRMPFRLQQQ